MQRRRAHRMDARMCKYSEGRWSMVTFSFLNSVGTGKRKGKRCSVWNVSVRLLRCLYGVQFPKVKCLITNGKCKPGPQDKGGPPEHKLH